MAATNQARRDSHMAGFVPADDDFSIRQDQSLPLHFSGEDDQIRHEFTSSSLDFEGRGLARITRTNTPTISTTVLRARDGNRLATLRASQTPAAMRRTDFEFLSTGADEPNPQGVGLMIQVRSFP